MNKYIAKRYQDMVPTGFTGAGDVKQDNPGLIDFTFGDPDFGTHESILTQAFEDARAGHTHYTAPSGDPELIDEIIRFHREEYGQRISRENIFVTTSGGHAMYLALESICNPGDEIILPEPFYPPYPTQVKIAGGTPVYLPLKEEEHFQINRRELEAAISDKTKALVINTPHNPTGTVLREETLRMIGEVVREKNILLLSDDIYTAFTYGRDFIPPAKLVDLPEQVISFYSFSKNYIMTGWRIGYMIGPADIIAVIKELNSAVVFTAPSISQRGALSALRNRSSIQPKIVETFRERVEYLAHRLSRLKGVKVISPEGAFYVYACIMGTGLSSEEFVRRLQEEASVLTLSGTAFGPNQEGYVRFAATIPLDQMEEAFDRVEEMELFRGE